VASAVAGIWMLWPLTALFSIWLRRPVAASAAILYLFLPGPWLLAGRALTDTPAAFLLVVTSAWWLRRRPVPGDLVGGSVAGGLCLLVRPQLAPAVVALVGWRLATARRSGDRWRVAGPLAGVVAAGAVATVLASGGLAPLTSALAEHLAYHVGGLSEIRHDLAGSGLARCLIRWELAAAWIALSALGLVAWAAHRSTVGSPWPLLVGLLAPLVLTTQALADPSHARYALPLLALTSGPVMIAAATVLRRWTVAVALVLAVLSAGLGLPQAAAYRCGESPPVVGLRAADEWALQRSGLVVVDRTLVSFADYGRAAGFLSAPVINDFQLEIGSAAAPPPERAAAVYAAGKGGFVRSAGATTIHGARPAWVRRLGPDRFMEVTVAERPQLTGVSSPW
jgi:hypothetical protein